MSELNLNNDYEVDRRLKTIVEPKKDQTFLKYFLSFSSIALITIIFGMFYWQYSIQSYKNRYLPKKERANETHKNSYKAPQDRTSQKESQVFINHGKEIEKQENKIIINDLNPIIKDVISKRENEVFRATKPSPSAKTKGLIKADGNRKLALPNPKLEGLAIYASSISHLKNLAKLDKSLTIIFPFEKLNDKRFLSAVRKGSFRVIVDVPMEAKSISDKTVLRTTLARADVEKYIKDIQTQLPNSIGISNRMGSRFLGDKKSVETLMMALSKYKLFFVHHRNGRYKIDQAAKKNNVRIFNAISVQDPKAIKLNNCLEVMYILQHSKKNLGFLKRLSAGR